MTKILLIRHGETDYNSQKKYCGSSNPGLNANGKMQCRKLRSKLKNVAVHKIYSSDLKRALQTSRIIFGRRHIIRARELREIDFGYIEGLKYSEVIKKRPAFYDKFMNYPEKIKFPGGESLKELSRRVLNKLETILSENRGKTVALVTHGGPARAISCKVLELPVKSFWHTNQAPGTISFLSIDSLSIHHLSDNGGWLPAKKRKPA